MGSAAISDDTNYCFPPHHAEAGRVALTQALPARLALPAGRGTRKRSGTAAAAPVTPEESARAARATRGTSAALLPPSAGVPAPPEAVWLPAKRLCWFFSLPAPELRSAAGSKGQERDGGAGECSGECNNQACIPAGLLRKL